MLYLRGFFGASIGCISALGASVIFASDWRLELLRERGKGSRVFRGVLVGFVFEKLLKIFTVEVAFGFAFNLTICR